MFLKRLTELMNIKCNGKQVILAENTGIAQGTISCYFTRGSMPSVDQLVKLAEYFECSIDYLLGREDDFGVINQTVNSLTSIQQELLFSFNLLDRDKQQQVIGFCKVLNY